MNTRPDENKSETETGKKSETDIHNKGQDNPVMEENEGNTGAAIREELNEAEKTDG